MALFKFTKAILNGESLDVYNYGKMQRDFTYIDDLVNGIRLLIEAIPSGNRLHDPTQHSNENISHVAPFRIVNLGNSKPENLMDFIYEIERCLNLKSKNFYPFKLVMFQPLGPILAFFKV